MGEAGAVRKVRLAALAESPEAFDVDPDEVAGWGISSWQIWIEGSDDLPRAVWLARRGEEVVGLVAAAVVADECRIGALFVEPGMRGAGVGGALLDAAEMWGHEVRAAKNVLSVSERNLGAQALYTARGYRSTGASRQTRHGHREVYMAKPIGL